MPYRAQTLKPIGWVHPEKRRPPANERGYGYQWRKLRARILERDPICGSASMFREDDREKAKFAPDKRDILAQAYLANIDRESQKALAAILKRVKKSKWRAK